MLEIGGGPKPPKFHVGHPVSKVNGPMDHPNISVKVGKFIAQSTLNKPNSSKSLGKEPPNTPYSQKS